MIIDGPAIARDLGMHPGTIRNWACHGRIERHGYDQRGRALYDYDDVAMLAIAAGIYEKEESDENAATE